MNKMIISMTVGVSIQGIAFVASSTCSLSPGDYDPMGSGQGKMLSDLHDQ